MDIRERPRLAGSRRARSGREGRRSFWGDGPGIDLAHKLATFSIAISTLAFAIFVYVHSVRPVFQKQIELDTAKQRARQLASEISNQKRERAALEQRLEAFQKSLALYRRGVVLSWLSQLRADLRSVAPLYRRQNPGSFDLRKYALARADAQLKQLGRVDKGDPRLQALEFFRQFVGRKVPPRSTDVHLLDSLLEDYDRQQVGPSPP